MIIVLLSACSPNPTIESAPIQKIRIVSTIIDPAKISLDEKTFFGFEITFEQEIRYGDFKTKTIFIPSTHSAGRGLLFIATANPHHKYALQHFKIKTDGERFYLNGGDPIFIKLLE
ncbi:MAG: hypothetical protein WC678_03410 [Parcubacteria group bacterium]